MRYEGVLRFCRWYSNYGSCLEHQGASQPFRDNRSLSYGGDILPGRTLPNRNDLEQPVVVRWQTERKRGSAGSGLANTFTNRVMFEPKGCRENGSFDASLMMSRAGQIMISHLNDNFLANALRRTDSLTSSRTTNVPTAPMLMTSNSAELFGDLRRLASIGASDVHGAKKND